MSTPIVGGNGQEQPKPRVVDFIKIQLLSNGTLAFSGTVIGSAQRTNVLLGQAVRDYNTTKLWEKVSEKQKTAIRPPSGKELSQFGS